MAMEKVYELSTSGRYDVVVLDTPPTQNALDFLHAPDRILDLLENDAARLVLGPMLTAGKIGLKLFNLGSTYVLKTLARFTGADAPPLSERLSSTLWEQATLADVDRRQVERVRHALPGVPVHCVPRLRRDVHDLAGLWQIDGYLAGEEE